MVSDAADLSLDYAILRISDGTGPHYMDIRETVTRLRVSGQLDWADALNRSYFFRGRARDMRFDVTARNSGGAGGNYLALALIDVPVARLEISGRVDGITYLARVLSDVEDEIVLRDLCLSDCAGLKLEAGSALGAVHKWNTRLLTEARAATVSTYALPADHTLFQLQDGQGAVLTIANGAVTALAARHRLETQGGAATDALETIAGGFAGDRLTLMTVDAARSVVVKDGTGNIALAAGDVALDDPAAWLTLECRQDGSWQEVAAG